MSWRTNSRYRPKMWFHFFGQMDIPIRSHMSMLTDDQVARIRARWEREKRVRAEKQAAPAPNRASSPDAPPFRSQSSSLWPRPPRSRSSPKKGSRRASGGRRAGRGRCRSGRRPRPASPRSKKRSPQKPRVSRPRAIGRSALKKRRSPKRRPPPLQPSDSELVRQSRSRVARAAPDGARVRCRAS